MPAKKSQAEPKTKVLKAKKSAAPAAKKAPKTATKSSTKTKAKAEPVKAAAPEAAPVITQDQIATRAYYIGERRQNMGWPGDPASDWIEAEAQLVAEAKRKK